MESLSMGHGLRLVIVEACQLVDEPANAFQEEDEGDEQMLDGVSCGDGAVHGVFPV